MNDKRKIRIKIDKEGKYTLEAMEGFSGESCIEKTKDIELILGGTVVERGKKDEYYDEGSAPNLFLSNM